MEDTDTQCMYRRIILYKYDKTQHCAGALETKGRKKHRLDQFNDTLITVDVQRLADHDSGLYADTLLDRKHESHAHRSHSQTSDLDQRRNDALTEGGEMIRCVNRDQTSHTDRAGRCEQRVNGSYRYAVPYRYGRSRIRAPRMITVAKPRVIRRPGGCFLNPFMKFSNIVFIFLCPCCLTNHFLLCSRKNSISVFAVLFEQDQ